MGICLDTEQQTGSQQLDALHPGREAWTRGAPSPERASPLHNAAKVKFEAPKVPVIFVLGGPGSGKVTHCDNLMHEKRGITHINMTDLLQQYAIGNDMKDFGQLSSKTVAEVLMLEMKMAPAAKTYLVSGYPRSMRDVVEYSNKIQIVNGVILVSWRQNILERQIDYGAKLGHVVLSLAKMELNNFFKHVMPVADYFDQRGMLYAVNGEREPAVVYKDFRAAALRLLGLHDTASGVPNKQPPLDASPKLAPPNPSAPLYRPPPKGFPPVIWVIGGPGSNKSALCAKVVRSAPGWVHCSVGRLLRTAAETTHPRQAEDASQLRKAIGAGDLAPQTYVMQLVESQMRTNMNAQGVLMDGFPRDMKQVHDFESKFNQQPTLMLLDCSKLQLGRGRLDDSVAAFRRRLELFREFTLPMLKTMDTESRLSIIDGDTETAPVQEEFSRVVLARIEELRRAGGLIVPQPSQKQPPPLLTDLEAQPEINSVSRIVAANGRPSRDTIRDMYAHVDNYPGDGHL